MFFVVWYFSFKASFEPNKSYFKEFFSGIKHNKLARLYFSFFILRRFLSVLIVVALEELPKYARVVPFAAVHLCVFLYSVGVRPFESAKDNIVEAVNDLSFGVLCGSLLVFNDEGEWKPAAVNSVIYFMLAASLVTTLVQLGFMVASIVKFVKGK